MELHVVYAGRLTVELPPEVTRDLEALNSLHAELTLRVYGTANSWEVSGRYTYEDKGSLVQGTIPLCPCHDEDEGALIVAALAETLNGPYPELRPHIYSLRSWSQDLLSAVIRGT